MSTEVNSDKFFYARTTNKKINTITFSYFFCYKEFKCTKPSSVDFFPSFVINSEPKVLVSDHDIMTDDASN